MNDTIKLKQGDTETPQALTLTDENGVAVDLTLASGGIVFSWRLAGASTSAITDRPVTAVDLAAGQIEIPWSSGDLDVTGTYIGEVVVTWPGGGEQTYPGDGGIEFYVAPDLRETAARVDARRRLELAAASSKDPVLDAESVAAILDRNRVADDAGYPVGHASWTETYDILSATVEAWETKAGLAACRTDIATGGGVKIERNQTHAACLRMADYYRRRKKGSAVMTAPNGRVRDLNALPVANGPDDFVDAGAGGAAGPVFPREEW